MHPGRGGPRVCHVIFDHSIFDGRVFHKEAVSLARAGYEVTLLVPEVFRGWMGRRREQAVTPGVPFVRNGVRFETYRCPKWVPHNFGLRRAVARRAIQSALQRLKPDVCHIHEDGVVLEAAAGLRGRLPGTRLIFDVHEFYLHQQRVSPRGRARLPAFLGAEQEVLASASGVITVSEFISTYYRTLFDGPVLTVMNSQSARIFARPPTAPADDGAFRVVHEGRFPFNRGLKLLVAAAALVREPAVRFLFIGRVPRPELEWFEEETRRLGIRDRFELTGMLPYQDVPAQLARGHLGIHFIQSRNGMTGIANKFFNYLCLGLPVLTLEHPVVGPLVREGKCGDVLPADAAAIAGRIDTLCRSRAEWEELHRNAERLFHEELNWERMEERLLAAYRTVLDADAR